MCNIISAVSGLQLVVSIPSHQDEKLFAVLCPLVFHREGQPANHTDPGSQGEEGHVPPPLKKTFIRNVFSVSPALNNGVLKTLSFFRILNFGKEDIFEFKVPVSSL